jgi:rhodanese-related sulfurtransferase
MNPASAGGPSLVAFLIANWPLVLTLVISGALLVWPLLGGRLSPAQQLGAQAATQMINRRNALLLDLREAADYAAGRIPNALHMPLGQLATRSGELARHVGRPVIAYCDSGARSRSAVRTLTKAGFKEVFTLHGGLQAWSDAGMPLEKG